MSECVICGNDDGLTLMCGKHWSEYVAWEKKRDEPGVVDGGVGGSGVVGRDRGERVGNRSHLEPVTDDTN